MMGGTTVAEGGPWPRGRQRPQHPAAWVRCESSGLSGPRAGQSRLWSRLEQGFLDRTVLPSPHQGT